MLNCACDGYSANGDCGADEGNPVWAANSGKGDFGAEELNGDCGVELDPLKPGGVEKLEGVNPGAKGLNPDDAVLTEGV